MQDPMQFPGSQQQPKMFEQSQLDLLTAQKFEAVNHYSLMQGNQFGETLSCGFCANQYLITDRTKLVQVEGRTELVEYPLFIVQEESDCCCRCLCPQHPILAKFYHARPPVAGPTHCNCCYGGHVWKADNTQPVALTVERDGCCAKWVGCPICCDKCQSEAWVHAGNVDGTPGAIGYSNSKAIGRSKVPNRGCFTPMMEVMEYDGQAEQQTGLLTGPCFFGGCLDLCVNTVFPITSAPGGTPSVSTGDTGRIVKQRPKGLREMCCQLHGDVDNYEIDLASSLTARQKANYIGTAVHVDYWFFQRDVRPITCHTDHQGNGVLVITLCNMYCKGCLIPICIAIPFGKK